MLINRGGTRTFINEPMSKKWAMSTFCTFGEIRDTDT